MKAVPPPVCRVFGKRTIFLTLCLLSSKLPNAGGQNWPQISFTTPIGGFHHPTHVTTARDGSGRLFVVEQSGLVRIVKNGAILGTPFLDITGRPGIQGDQGLLSVAFPPDYAVKQHFYVNYVTATNTLVVARYTVSSNPDIADANSEQIVLTVGPFENSSSHFGGELTFGPLDGYLYLGVGTGSGGAPNGLGQDLTVLFGKMLRIDVETGDPATYTIPSTNPYQATPNARAEIWALGLRNLFRSSFDRQSGDFYIADVGENAREEVDFQSANDVGGANYGWDIMEGTLCFNADTCDTSGLTLPITEYDHSQGCAITGGIVYRAAQYPTFQGIYFYGDWCSGNVWGLQQINGSWQSSLLSQSTMSIIGFTEDEAGSFWVADYSGGAIYSIVDRPPSPVDLAVTETDSADPSAIGNPLTYTIQIVNNGSVGATGVIINDSWTAGVPFLSVTSDHGTCTHSGNTATCRIPSLIAGETANITFVLKPSATGTVTNTASASANEPDPDTTNNWVTENTTITNPPVQVTVQTNPSGLAFTVDGTVYSSMQIFSWGPGSSHTISTTSPQNGATGVRYVWNNWSDGGAISHTVAPRANKIYTAKLSTQYFLTMVGGTGGKVSPMSGWKNSGSIISISATPTNNALVGYNFAGWTGTGSGSYSGANNPASIIMNGPMTETAAFTQNPVQVTVQTNPAGRTFTVDSVTYTSAQTFSWQPGSSHTMATSSPQNGNAGVRYMWKNWSDSGAISHVVAPTTNKTYTANFTTQYFLTMTAGTGGKLSPASGWKNSGAVFSISATPVTAYTFTNWTGTGTGSFSGTTNPASITMGGPVSETATFTHN
jgi:uncharacterized repeat protein (TIGR01451 family)